MESEGAAVSSPSVTPECMKTCVTVKLAPITNWLTITIQFRYAHGVDKTGKGWSPKVIQKGWALYKIERCRLGTQEAYDWVCACDNLVKLHVCRELWSTLWAPALSCCRSSAEAVLGPWRHQQVLPFLVLGSVNLICYLSSNEKSLNA